MPRTTGSDDLYRLICSLSPEEKGYFKKFALRHSQKQSKHLQLFDTISKQTEFEEASLKKKFPGYVDMKGYLFEMILDSLQLGGILKDIPAECVRIWQQVQVLKTKGLQKKALQLSRQGYEKAHECEVFWLEMVFRKESFNMSRLSWSLEEREKNVADYFADIQVIIQKETEANKYHRLNQEYHTLSLKRDYGIGINGSNFSEQAILPSYTEPTLSAIGERMKLSAIDMYYHASADEPNAYLAAKKMYEFEKKLYAKNSPLSGFEKRIKSIRVFIIACFALQKYDEAAVLNQEMIKIKSTSVLQNSENEIMHFSYTNCIMWGTGKHAEGEQLYRTNFPHKTVEQYSSRFQMIMLELQKFSLLLQFSNKNTGEVFKSIANLQQVTDKKDTTYYYKCAELLKLLTHIDANNFDVLPNLVPATIKHLKGYGLTKFEKEIFQQLKNMNSGNRKNILSQILSQLKNTNEQIWLFMALNLSTWCRQYTENKKLNELVAKQTVAQ